jgi:hypothetical protein
MIKNLNEKQKLKALAGLLKENEFEQDSNSGLEYSDEFAEYSTSELADHIEAYITQLAGRGEIANKNKEAVQMMLSHGKELCRVLRYINM